MTTDIAITNDGSRVICGDAAYSNGQLVQMLTGEDHLGNQTPAKPHIKGPIGLYTEQTTAIVSGAPDLPVGFVPYYSHTWNGSAYVETGYSAPVAGLWDNKAAIPPDDFPSMVVNALTKHFFENDQVTQGDQAASLAKAADEFDRMWNDKRSAWVRATINAPTMVWLDPNDKPGNFHKMIAYMKTTTAQADSDPIMKTGYEAAIAAGWPDA